MNPIRRFSSNWMFAQEAIPASHRIAILRLWSWSLTSAAVTLLCLALGTGAARGQVSGNHEPQANSTGVNNSVLDVGVYFAGDWNMRGRFRYDSTADWMPTRSQLVGTAKLDSEIIVRDIEAPQIGFAALDLITHNPTTNTVQYIYINNRTNTALLYEGSCSEGCRRLLFEQLCGPYSGPSCGSRSTITIESEDRFVARDFLPGRSPDAEIMTREVIYERAVTPP